jgi:hypothetical protein
LFEELAGAWLGTFVYDGGRVARDGGMVSKAILNVGFCIWDLETWHSEFHHIENLADNTQLS